MGKKMLVLGVLCLSLGLFGCTTNNTENEGDESVKTESDEDYKGESNKKEYNKNTNEDSMIKDSNEEIEDNNEVKKNDLDTAYDVILPLVQSSFSGQDYEFTKENGDTILLKVQMSKSDISSTDINSWNQFVDIAVESNKNGLDLLEQYGVDVNYAFAVGDKYNDEYFLLVKNGVVVFDVFNQ
ncbi:MAG: hypothetical protein RR359_03410 [Bacilli bacterium]